MRVVINRFLVSAIVVSWFAVLSACGGGGGRTVVPDPGLPTLIPLTLPAGHGLSAGRIPLASGASDQLGNVTVSCPRDGEDCVLNIADDGSGSYQETGGVPVVVAAFPPPARMPEGLSALPPMVRHNVARRLAATAVTDAVSSTASMTDTAPATGGVWNTGVTQAPLNMAQDTPGDNRAINAGYVGGRLVFERIELEQGFIQSTAAAPAPPGYLARVYPPPGASHWKGVEHFFITRDGGRYRSVFYTDIQDDTDTDYLALGYWAWTAGPGGNRVPFVGAAASGNDPFDPGLVAPVQGQATYRGAATGLYAGQGAFRSFDADVRLTADFDANRISGSVTGGRDSSNGATLFDDLALGEADIQNAGAAYFRGEVTGALGGQQAMGRWGGQFYGNGRATTDTPVSVAEAPGSVAGTFGARVPDGDSLLGVFGAYRDEDE